MPIEFTNEAEIAHDDFSGDNFDAWHHEGVGTMQHAPRGGMRLHCFGSKQGGEGCMLFFRSDLPDQIAVEYDVTIRSHGGTFINYLAIRGENGEDMIRDRDKLPPRTGIMRNYWNKKWKLQSYHISFSRFKDNGEPTRDSNWRRNPGLLLVGYGVDPVQEINRQYHVRLVKDGGHCQFHIDGKFVHAFIDRDASRPIPDYGKFGFRLIGSDVMVDVENFVVHRIEHNAKI